jgi:predicted dehydrogenase
MIEASERNGKLLSVVCQNRFKTPVAKVKRMLDSGAVGSVLLATFNSLWWRGEMYYDLWWRGTWEQESGGCFLNHSVHHVDLMHMLFGIPLTVRGFIANVGHDNSECEDLGFALFDYGHMIVNFTSSLVSHGEKQTISIQGKKGSLEIPWSIEASRPQPNGFPETDGETAARLQEQYDSLPGLPYEGHPAQVLNFLRAIAREEPLAIDGNEGKRTLELIIAVYKSSVEERAVSLPIPREDPFYRKESMIASMPRFHEKKRSVENFGTSSAISLGRNMGK